MTPQMQNLLFDADKAQIKYKLLEMSFADMFRKNITIEDLENLNKK